VELIDTTCPRVVKVQHLAKTFIERDAQIIIIGEKNHKEVRGIFEWAKKRAIFVETDEDLCGLVLDLQKKIVILSQTTQDQEFVERTAVYIKKRYPQAQIMDSICLTTHHRQTEIKEMAAKNDVVIVIGSPESANSNRLWEIAQRNNEKSYFIERTDQLKKDWFIGCSTVGVTAGASTPGWIIDDVITKLKKF